MDVESMKPPNERSTAQAVTFARRATSRVMKHGLNVYPLEAYGVLIGQPEPVAI